MNTIERIGLAVMAWAVMITFPIRAAEGPPDLTMGETKGVDRKGTYNLVATAVEDAIKAIETATTKES